MLVSLTAYAQNRDTIYLWEDKVPGELSAKHPAVQSLNNKGDVTRLSEVTNPLMLVFEPEESLNNGAAVLVCPGGGYNILAIDLEGYEIAEWLNRMGFTAFVLQYRVPKKKEGALMDIQKALKIVRQNAEKWQVNPEKIGVIGFSAGGSLCARASTRFSDKTYPWTEAVDTVSCRPDFAMLIYPAFLDQGENRSLTPELVVKETTPPVFLFATADDKHANSALVMAGALRDNKIPVELHLLHEGGHGYGLRKGNPAAESWPVLAESWLNRMILNQNPDLLNSAF